MDKTRDSKTTRSGIYRSLDPGQIRLLTLLPTTSDERSIRCILEAVSLDIQPFPSYKALSYTWGNAEDALNILVNGQSFQTTSNLNAALEMFGKTEHAHSTLTLWVDAICINQQDALEKSTQVQLMRKIFSQAEETWIWLGPEAHGSGNGIGLIMDLSATYLQSCKSAEGRRETADKTIWEAVEFDDRVEDLVAIDWIFARDYWYRVWVVQEIAASKQILIFCGLQTFSWESVLFAAYILDHQVYTKLLVQEYHKKRGALREFPGASRGLQSGIQRIMSIESSRVEIQQPGNPESHDSLLLVLSNHRSTEATELKDKFIALAGLVNEERNENAAIIPNLYDETVTVSDVYIFAVQTLVLPFVQKNQHIKPLDFLDSAGQSNMEDLPSWVPDWSSTNRRAVPLLYWQIGSQRHPDLVYLNASGRHQHLKFGIQTRKGALLAKGFVVDCIAEVNSSQRPLMEDHTSQDSEDDDLTYPTGEDTSNAIRRTLVLDRGHADGLKAASEWGDIFYRHIACPPKSPDLSTPTTNAYEQWYEQNKDFKVCGATLDRLAQIRKCRLPSPKDDALALAHFKSAFITAVGHRKLASTQKGYVCLAPLSTLPGDMVVILADCSAPIILRKWSWSQSCEFLGTVYVHGIMHGEAIADSEDPFAQEFDIR
ncbi:HET-domain-containing protein [Cadophora sp. DSE1049]|nr:HET-domain-containing protein [Cadophora sp. DSE1049]